MAWEPKQDLAFLGWLFHSPLNGGGHLGLRRSVRAQRGVKIGESQFLSSDGRLGQGHKPQ